MLEKRKQEAAVRQWIEQERERLSERAYGLESSFPTAFYAQCVESTAADAHEIFLETPLTFNYFRANVYRMEASHIKRFYKLAAIHHIKI